MHLKNFEEMCTKMKEKTEKEYLNKRNTVPNAVNTEVGHVRTEFEHLKKEYEQAEVQHEGDFLTMAVNIAKSWWS